MPNPFPAPNAVRLAPLALAFAERVTVLPTMFVIVTGAFVPPPFVVKVRTPAPVMTWPITKPVASSTVAELLPEVVVRVCVTPPLASESMAKVPLVKVVVPV